MTISKKQLEEARASSFKNGIERGKELGREEINSSQQYDRRKAIIETTKAASEMAIAQSKLAYAMSKILENLK
jgi:hypothetical protein